MRIKNIYLLLTLFFSWAVAMTATAQQIEFHIGDRYQFPDGTVGIVCYVNPNNPKEGWVVDLIDVPAKENQPNKAGTFKLVDNTPVPMENYVPEVRTWDMCGWSFRGKEDTRKLYDNIINSPILNNDYVEKRCFNGWYIPDIQQLSQFIALLPYIKNSILDYGGYVDMTANYSYWSSTPASSTHVWLIPNSKDYFKTEAFSASTTNARVRLVREFKVDAAYAYWVADTPRISNSMTVFPTADTNYYDANVVYDDSTYTGFQTVVYRHPVYRFKNGDNRPYIYDTTCVSTTKYTSKKDSHFTNIDVSKPVASKQYEVKLGTVKYGCDSLIRLMLTVNPVYDYYDTAVICRGETFVWERDHKSYSAEGDYEAAFKTANGCNCDSIWHLHLMVLMDEIEVNPVEPWVCKGGTLELAATTYNCGDVSQNTYYDGFDKAKGVGDGTQITDFSSKTALFASGENVYGTGQPIVRLGQFKNNVAYWGKIVSKPLALTPQQPFIVKVAMKGWGKSN
jgi:hypothetical protein